MNNTLTLQQAQSQLGINIGELLELATIGLTKMFNPKTHRFCFRLNREDHRLAPEGDSLRYTLMTLLGLHKLEAAGMASPIDVRAAFENVIKTADQVDDVGDLGLLIWLTAVVSPQALESLYSRIDVGSALTRYITARHGKTMELSWFLSGLAHTALAGTGNTNDAALAALKTYQLIKANQGATGVFGHLARGSGIAGHLRGRIGSFADQVYPIYAFSKFAQAYNVSDALQSALNCAYAICGAQGRLGQWWWHYDSLTGKTIQHYPVYSVHQHGMAPMALFALAEASQEDFKSPICKGLNWIGGHNELQSDLRDRSAAVIWRSVYDKDVGRYFGVAMNFVRKEEHVPAPTNMRVKFECRPYELGWLLYALAGREVTFAQNTCLSSSLFFSPRLSDRTLPKSPNDDSRLHPRATNGSAGS